MLYYDRIHVNEGNYVNKKNASKEYDICHYWYFLNFSFKFLANVCNRSHGLLIMSINISDIAISNIKVFNYQKMRSFLALITKNEAIKLM